MLYGNIKNILSASAVGIIGGADGPTAIITVTSNPMDWLLIAILIAVIVGLVALFAVKIKRRKGKRYRHKKMDDTADNNGGTSDKD
nr:hypothetical protein [Clostridia bacterium]